MWDLSGPGTTPGSPAQAGGVLTTRAPGKPSPWLLFLNIVFMRKHKSRTEHPELWKRWEMGKQWKQCQTLYFWAPKSLQMVTAAMKLKCLLPGRKVMTNLDSIFKSRDITLPTEVRLLKAMVCPVVMYGCESWTIKEAER